MPAAAEAKQAGFHPALPAVRPKETQQFEQRAHSITFVPLMNALHSVVFVEHAAVAVAVSGWYR